MACSAVYFLTAPGRIDMIDGGIRYDAAESLIELGKPIIRHPWLPAPVGVDGERYSLYPPGTSLIAIPFVEIGGWLGGGSLESKQFAFSLVTIPFAAGVVAVLFLVWGHLGVPMRNALAWALVVAFCTTLWPYAGSTFDTAIQAFLLTVGVCSAVQAIGTGSLRWALAAGVSFAVLVNIVEIYVVLVACVLADFPVRAKTLLQRLRMPAVWVIFSVTALGLFLVLLYNKHTFGHPLQTGRAMVPHPFLGLLPVGMVGLFLSPAKSIFLYCPVYFFALWGTRRFLHRNLQWYAPVAACLTMQILITASLRFWAGEWAWGPRYLVTSLPLACVGLPFLEMPRLRRVITGAVVAGFVVQILAISVDHQRHYLEKGRAPYFWLDESTMYTDSALFARPGELLSVIRQEGMSQVRWLNPARDRMSMTSSLFGPPPKKANEGPDRVRDFLVFRVPRPWTFWAPRIPPDLRPGPAGTMTLAGLAVAFVAGVAIVVRSRS